MFFYNGNYYLLFNSGDSESTYSKAMVEYLKSPNLNIDNSGSLNWEWQDHIPDKGINAIEIQNVDNDNYIMSQRISNTDTSGDYSLDWGDLRLKRMVWKDDGTFETSNLTRLSCSVHSKNINPDHPELCGNIIDDNCNGEIDENCIPLTHSKLLFSPADISNLRSEIADGGYDQEAFEKAKIEADRFLTLEDYNLIIKHNPNSCLSKTDR